jgi:hypothetical protein
MRTFLNCTSASLLVLLAVWLFRACSAPSENASNIEAWNIDSLQVTPVDLGTLQTGETCQFKVSLRNTSAWPIALSSPQTDCGCIHQGENKPLFIAADTSIEVMFSFRAPTWPGDVHKKITFIAHDAANLVWQVPVAGRVVAKAWAVPPALELSWDGKSVLEPSIALYHDEQTTIGPVVSNSPAVSVEKETGKTLHLNLTIHPPPLKAGDTWETILQVFDLSCTSELLRIPVRVTRPAELRCIPTEIRLTSANEPGNRLERTVLVLTHADVGSALDVKPLFPWIHIDNVERRPRGFSVSLHVDRSAVPVDRSAVPENFGDSIVQFSLPGKPTSACLRGVGNR